jgi:hypothetical protein
LGPFRTKSLTATGDASETHALNLRLRRRDSLSKSGSFGTVVLAQLLQQFPSFVERFRQLR